MTRRRLAAVLVAAAALGGAVAWQLAARRPRPRLEDARDIDQADRVPPTPGEAWP